MPSEIIFKHFRTFRKQFFQEHLNFKRYILRFTTYRNLRGVIIWPYNWIEIRGLLLYPTTMKRKTFLLFLLLLQILCFRKLCTVLKRCAVFNQLCNNFLTRHSILAERHYRLLVQLLWLTAVDNVSVVLCFFFSTVICYSKKETFVNAYGFSAFSLVNSWLTLVYTWI